MTQGKQQDDAGIADQRQVLDNISDIGEQVKNVIKNNQSSSQSLDKAASVQNSQKKELGALKDSIYLVELEKTINDMFIVMKSMEEQVKSLLKINATLGEDLNWSKDIISGLKESNKNLKAEIAMMKEELPSKKALQIEIDYLIEERNKAEMQIRELKSSIEKSQKRAERWNEKSTTLENQRNDFISEIHYLESKLHSDAEKAKWYKNEIKILQGRILAYEEKLKFYKAELAESLDEKYKLVSELKASKFALRELRSTFADSKLQEKKAFYDEMNTSYSVQDIVEPDIAEEGEITEAEAAEEDADEEEAVEAEAAEEDADEEEAVEAEAAEEDADEEEAAEDEIIRSWGRPLGDADEEDEEELTLAPEESTENEEETVEPGADEKKLKKGKQQKKREPMKIYPVKKKPD